MKRMAVFVDAGYFWVQVSRLVLGARVPRTAVTIDYAKMREAVLAEVTSQFQDCDLLRVYWYDGPGPHGKTPEHASIEALDDFKLRLGTRNGVGQQKAVDGLVIADMISLTQSKAISDALLVSGDADMTPGVVAAQAMGLRVHLLSIGGNSATSPHLAAEVDRKTDWATNVISPFAKPANAQVQAQSAPLAKAGAAASASSVASTTQPAAQAPPTPSTSLPGKGTPPPPEGAALSLPAIAQAAYSALKMGPQSATLAALGPKAVRLPAAVDKVLLATARQEANRALTEAEKRALRLEFKKLL